MNDLLQQKITDYWHISRTALAGMSTVPTRCDRMQYVKDALKKHDGNLTDGLTSKQLWLAIEDATSPTSYNNILDRYKYQF